MNTDTNSLMFINITNVKKVVVFDKCPWFRFYIADATKERRNFWGEVIKKAEPSRYCSFTNGFISENPEDIVEEEKKCGVSLEYDKKTNTFFELPKVIVSYMENDNMTTYIRYFASFEEAKLSANGLAKRTDLQLIFS